MIPITTLLGGYRTGYFPMAVDEGVRWFSPGQRGVIPLDRFRVTRRLARMLRQRRFQCTVNRAFREVIVACASRADPRGNWIDSKIIESYCVFHRAGYAHSVEVWDGEQLAGGLYGVSLRGAFFGESMFHHVRDSSKVALCFLVDRLKNHGYHLLDVQWLTPYLSQFGAIEIPRSRFLMMLDESMRYNCRFDDSGGCIREPNRLVDRELQPDSNSTDAPS